MAEFALFSAWMQHISYKSKASYVSLLRVCVCVRERACTFPLARLHCSVFMLWLTTKLELGWLLVCGVNFGLGGFPASRSLCLLLFMCCRQEQNYQRPANKHLLCHNEATSNVICWIINENMSSLSKVSWNNITLLPAHRHFMYFSARSSNRLIVRPPGTRNVYAFKSKVAGGLSWFFDTFLLTHAQNAFDRLLNIEGQTLILWGLSGSECKWWSSAEELWGQVSCPSNAG